MVAPTLPQAYKPLFPFETFLFVFFSPNSFCKLVKPLIKLKKGTKKDFEEDWENQKPFFLMQKGLSSRRYIHIVLPVIIIITET